MQWTASTSNTPLHSAPRGHCVPALCVCVEPPAEQLVAEHKGAVVAAAPVTHVEGHILEGGAADGARPLPRCAGDTPGQVLPEAHARMHGWVDAAHSAHSGRTTQPGSRGILPPARVLLSAAHALVAPGLWHPSCWPARTQQEPGWWGGPRRRWPLHTRMRLQRPPGWPPLGNMHLAQDIPLNSSPMCSSGGRCPPPPRTW